MFGIYRETANVRKPRIIHIHIQDSVLRTLIYPVKTATGMENSGHSGALGILHYDYVCEICQRRETLCDKENEEVLRFLILGFAF